MSTEFFSTMEQLERKAKTVKYLEGSHPELFSKYHGEAKMLLFSLEELEKRIQADLKKKATATLNKKKKKT